jgi:hypothetical protein
MNTQCKHCDDDASQTFPECGDAILSADVFQKRLHCSNNFYYRDIGIMRAHASTAPSRVFKNTICGL